MGEMRFKGAGREMLELVANNQGGWCKSFAVFTEWKTFPEQLAGLSKRKYVLGIET